MRGLSRINGCVELVIVDKCSTAASLLSMSFAINAIFTGLSFTKFNLCSFVRKIAITCIKRTTGAKFLERVERLCECDEEVGKKLNSFSKTAKSYTRRLSKNPVVWEWVRRAFTVIPALTAFVLLTVEPETRIGVVLVFPYIFILFLFLLRSVYYMLCVLIRYGLLLIAMNSADKMQKQTFEVKNCIAQLMSTKGELAKVQRKTTKKQTKKQH